MQTNCLSPDGQFKIEFETREVRMSHWISSPRISRVDGNALLLDLWGTTWDAEIYFELGMIFMLLRKYPGGHPDISVYIDPLARVFWFGETPWRQQTLARFLPALEEKLAGLQYI